MWPAPCDSRRTRAAQSLTLLVVAVGCAEVLGLAAPRHADIHTPSTSAFRVADSGSRQSNASSILHKASLVSAGGPSSHTFSQDTSSISVQPQPRQQSWDLRLCNAYAYDGWVHVFHGVGRRAATSYTTSSKGSGETMLTKASGPLPFKRCTDVLDVALEVGSVLNFRIAGDMHIGTFAVQDLPEQGSMLQLILKRRDTWSTAADFSSHVFAKTNGPQVALVNAYLGPARSLLEVRDVPTGFDSLQESPSKLEEVHFGTVVDIAAGNYEWRLLDAHGPRRHAEKGYVEFKAVGKTPYTIVRVGTEAVGGESYPEELLVWPADGAVVHRGFADSGTGKRGLFGIPTDLSESSPYSSRRSIASSKLPSLAALILTTVAVAQ